MHLSLPPRIQKLIDERVKSGRYKTVEDVVAAAVVTLDQQEALGEFEAGEVEQLLEEGERSGAPLDGAEVLAEFSALRARNQPKAG